LRLGREMSVFVDATQPLEERVRAVMPLPDSTTRRWPSVSRMTPRGVVRLPAILTACQPLATWEGYLIAGTPGHDAGTASEACRSVKSRTPVGVACNPTMTYPS